MEQHIKQSKWLSYKLRHDQGVAASCMDDEGYVAIVDLMRWALQDGMVLTYQLIEEIVNTDSKQRYSIIEGKNPTVSAFGVKMVHMKIRANQGHSVTKGPKFEQIEPPEYLYHGTALHFHDTIFKEGITKQSRQHVHLSADAHVAKAVGSRHGDPVVLVVRASQMAQDGYVFYKSENHVWLTDHVPAKYIV